MKKYLILFLPLLLASCSSIFCEHSGSILFKNTGAETIYVRHVEGFNLEPPVGYLIPDSFKGSSMSCNNVPKEILIVWFYEKDTAVEKSSIFFDVPDDKIHESIVDIKKIEGFRITSDIIFTFNENGQWGVSLSK